MDAKCSHFSRKLHKAPHSNKSTLDTGFLRSAICRIAFDWCACEKTGKKLVYFYLRREKEMQILTKIFILSAGRRKGCGQLNRHE